ncbi:MAG: hypothetical protein IT185_05990, partial [Acidobacteria bacterium]|nr:hypothetical protein [Acidobacteriota bacterium]
TALIVAGDSIWTSNAGGRLIQTLPLALKMPITGIYCAAGGPISQNYNDPGGNIGDKAGQQSLFTFEQFTGLNQCLRYCLDKDSVQPAGGWHSALASSSYDAQDIPDTVIVYGTSSGGAPAWNATCTQAGSGAAAKVCYEDTTTKRIYLKTTSGTLNGSGTLTLSDATTRTAVASATAISPAMANTNTIPNSMRRQMFTASPAAGNAICKIRASSAGLLHGHRSYTTKNHADFTAQNTAVNCGLVYYSNASSPNQCNLVAYRGGVQKSSTTITMNDGGGTIKKSTTALDVTTTSADIEFQLQRGTGTINADTTYVDFVGATIEIPGATTGCFPISLGQAGWNANDWINPSLITTNGIAAFLSAVVGTTRDWVVVIPMLQNQTGAELADLNAGSSDVAFASLMAMVDTWKSIAALAGARLSLIFVTPYETYDSTATPKISKTDTNMQNVVEAHWRAALASGGMFVNTYRNAVNASLAQTGRSNGSSFTYAERLLEDTTTTNIHPNFNGSRYFASMLNAAIEVMAEPPLTPQARGRG